MNDAIRFHPQAPYDIADAISWYEEKSMPLANSFRAALREAFARIRLQPLTYGIVFDDVRVARVARFPYLVQYRIHSEVPVVLGVFHSASNPEKWRRRARKDVR